MLFAGNTNINFSVALMLPKVGFLMGTIEFGLGSATRFLRTNPRKGLKLIFNQKKKKKEGSNRGYEIVKSNKMEKGF